MTVAFYGLGDMLTHDFMRNAFIAGTAIAVACAMVGHHLLLRSQVFTADAMSHVAFTGALGALAFGLDLRVGLFAAVIGVSIVLGLLGIRGRPDDVVIGTVFVWVLGVGVLFLSRFATHHATGDSTAGVSVLFGSIFGLDRDRTIVATAIAVGVVLTVIVAARPLLFASIDEAVAAARGVPVRPLGVGFLVLVGIASAEATQAVGALLLLGLLTAPAATAQKLTTRPYRALALGAGIAVAGTWVGLIVSYRVADVPPSFAIIAVLTAMYAGVALCGAVGASPAATLRRWRTPRRPGTAAGRLDEDLRRAERVPPAQPG